MKLSSRGRLPPARLLVILVQSPEYTPRRTTQPRIRRLEHIPAHASKRGAQPWYQRPAHLRIHAPMQLATTELLEHQRHVLAGVCTRGCRLVRQRGAAARRAAHRRGGWLGNGYEEAGERGGVGGARPLSGRVVSEREPWWVDRRANGAARVRVVCEERADEVLQEGHEQVEAAAEALAVGCKRCLSEAGETRQDEWSGACGQCRAEEGTSGRDGVDECFNGALGERVILGGVVSCEGSTSRRDDAYLGLQDEE